MRKTLTIEREVGRESRALGVAPGLVGDKKGLGRGELVIKSSAGRVSGFGAAGGGESLRGEDRVMTSFSSRSSSLSGFVLGIVFEGDRNDIRVI